MEPLAALSPQEPRRRRGPTRQMCRKHAARAAPPHAEWGREAVSGLPDPWPVRHPAGGVRWYPRYATSIGESRTGLNRVRGWATPGTNRRAPARSPGRGRNVIRKPRLASVPSGRGVARGGAMQPDPGALADVGLEALRAAFLVMGEEDLLQPVALV